MGNLLSSVLGRAKSHPAPQRQVVRGTGDVASTSEKTGGGEDQDVLSSYWTDWSRIIRDRPLDEKSKSMVVQLKQIEKQMAQLEKVEKRLWSTSHETERVDSDQLLKEIQRTVQTSQPPRKKDLADLQKLDKLHHLRHEKYQVVSTLLRTVVPNNLMPRTGSEPGLSGSRFWAVVIGVDKYHNDGSLSLDGCTNDAARIWQYLTTDLSIPHNHILILAEGKIFDKSMPLKSPKPPTRENILRALYDHLRNNKSIRQGDAILVYFSGRGTTYSSAEVFTPKPGTLPSPIHAICPADRGLKNAKKPGPKTFDISDRELTVILSEIREAKAASITLILDCSYPSPSDLRGSSSAADNTIAITFNSRSAPPLQDATKDMLLAADNDRRRRSKTRRACVEDWKVDMSHVVMAACSSGQQARERAFEDGKIRGIFTQALVSALQSRRNDALTYERLLEVICPLEGQIPVVTGTRSNAAVWTQADLPNENMEVDVISR